MNLCFSFSSFTIFVGILPSALTTWSSGLCLCTVLDFSLLFIFIVNPWLVFKRGGKVGVRQTPRHTKGIGGMGRTHRDSQGSPRAKEQCTVSVHYTQFGFGGGKNLVTYTHQVYSTPLEFWRGLCSLTLA